MSTEQMVVRGVKGGVLIALPPNPWFAQRDMVITRIQSQERFFKGGRIALDVGSSDWSEDQLIKLLRDMADEGVCLWAVLSTSPITLTSARNFGIATSVRTEEPSEPESKENPASDSMERMHVSRNNLGSGEKLVVDGDLIILGDVEKGAELSVSGSLIVWGAVYGKVHAGCAGNRNAKIHLLAWGNGTVSLSGVLAVFPRKIRKARGIEILWENESVVVHECYRGRSSWL